MNEILEDEIRYGLLETKLHDFKQLLTEITKLDLNNLDNRQDLQFDNGIALNPSDAALCIQDLMRTRQFVRGIYQAIEDLLKTEQQAIHLFYAGTGPFATLILPILTKIHSDDLRLTLMDVNKKTLQFLDRVIHTLSIENYIEDIICADASTYQFQQAETIDILVSETMQYGLVKEQQVPIMINLVQQLPESTVIIPQNIQLTLGLKRLDVHALFEGKAPSLYQTLTHLLDFDAEFIRSIDSDTIVFDLCKHFDYTDSKDNFDQLVILTRIQTYKDHWIEIDLSGLTISKTLFDLKAEDGKHISLSYVIQQEPDFDFVLS